MSLITRFGQLVLLLVVVAVMLTRGLAQPGNSPPNFSPAFLRLPRTSAEAITAAPQRFIAVLDEAFRTSSATTESTINILTETFSLRINKKFTFGFAFTAGNAVFGNATRTLMNNHSAVSFVQEDLVVSIGQFGRRPGRRPRRRPRRGRPGRDPPEEEEPEPEEPDHPTQGLSTGLHRINWAGGVRDIIEGQLKDGIKALVVAVVDTGIGPHADLNVIGGTNFHDSFPSSSHDDDNGHGTHCAGIIGALDNEIGVVGVAPGVGLLAVKALGSDGSGYTSNVVAGIEWAVANGADVINLSLGGSASSDQLSCGPRCDCQDAQHVAVCLAVRSNVVVVAAAGNAARDAIYQSPAKYSECITVSSLSDYDGVPGALSASRECSVADTDDASASYTNYGSTISVMAPGTCIVSTSKDNTYSRMSGTSMSAPFVSGAAALLRVVHPEWGAASVKEHIMTHGSQDYTHNCPDDAKEALLDMQLLLSTA